MPESTLTLSIVDLKAEIGHYLGYGRGSDTFNETAWTTLQNNNITAVLKSGLAQVYTPPPISDREPSHNWSFLRPFSTVSLTSGSATADLPDDFGGFEGPIYITSANRRRWSIPVTNEGMVQERHAQDSDTTGPPQIACEKVLKPTTLTEGTRSQIYVWPTPDQAYTLAVEYKYLPDALTGLLPFPPGGSEHSELFKASCLAAAELQLDDAAGPRWQFFMQRLTASVHADRKRKGQHLGYNGDASDRSFMPGFRDDRFYYGSGVTYNGNPL